MGSQHEHAAHRMCMHLIIKNSKSEKISELLRSYAEWNYND